MRAFLDEFFVRNIGIPVPDFDECAILDWSVWGEGLDLDKVHVFHVGEVGLLKYEPHIRLHI
jgi:hypothetical protein